MEASFEEHNLIVHYGLQTRGCEARCQQQSLPQEDVGPLRALGGARVTLVQSVNRTMCGPECMLVGEHVRKGEVHRSRAVRDVQDFDGSDLGLGAGFPTGEAT